MTFLIGPNARGKTSLLEAVCCLLRLQSPRTASLSEAVRFGQAGFCLDGHCEGKHLRLIYGPRGRKVEMDSVVQAKTTEYLKTGIVSWIGSEDMGLVRAGGAARRRYLDFIGSQTVPGYLRMLRDYERALRSRNLLLRAPTPDRTQIQAFRDALVKAGDFLREARVSLVEKLKPHAARFCREISGKDELELVYEPGASVPLAEALEESWEKDLRLRQTTCGPHRDDVALHLNGKNAGSFASEGQQRTVSLSLKLAQTRVLEEESGRRPVLLIDDVFGELDSTRRNAFLRLLPENTQKIITTTSLSWMENEMPEAQFFLLEEQGLKPVTWKTLTA